ncbi:prephenate dehydrogenase [Fibrobacterales bacterium]|nr:prephenate dehydrogenase [Fibrobacterales bacterium]
MLNGRITIVGFGLLAGSIAMAVKQANLSVKIRAVSSKETLEKALELSLADEFFEYESVEKWVKDSDLILLCSPIKHILKMINAIAKCGIQVAGDKKIVVSDIGSTKEEICKAGFALPKPFVFVGGHPMAGSEKRSVEHSDSAMFENAYWLYCMPSAENSPNNKPPEILLELLHFLGSRAVQISPVEHDFVMSWLSHAPQLISTSIASGLSPAVLEKHLHLAGGGFRDMTRIAGSSWGMWKDILETNRKNVSTALGVYAQKALEIKSYLSETSHCEIQNEKNLETAFLQANQTRHSLENGRNYAYSLYEIIVQISDEPGAILKVLQPLSEQNINIRDIELMKVRENIGGILVLAFKNLSDADRAISILESRGITTKKKV